MGGTSAEEDRRADTITIQCVTDNPNPNPTHNRNPNPNQVERVIQKEDSVQTATELCLAQVQRRITVLTLLPYNVLLTTYP